MGFTRRGDRLQLIGKPSRVIEIEGGADGRLSRREARRFLGAMVAQAMHDGMLALHLRVSEKPAGLSLSYLGLDNEGTPTEYEMTPPPLASYPYLLQCALSLATLEPGLPLRGMIACDGTRGARQVMLEVNAGLEMHLRWGP